MFPLTVLVHLRVKDCTCSVGGVPTNWVTLGATESETEAQLSKRNRIKAIPDKTVLVGATMVENVEGGGLADR